MTFATLVGSVVGVLNSDIVPTIFALAILAYLWLLADYFIIHGSEDAMRERGRQTAVWGLLGIVVFVALWGIVNILLSTLNIAAS